MEAHANIPPVELLMHRVCHRAAIRLAALPDSHSLYKPVLTCTCQWAKHHLSPIHVLLQAYDIKPAVYETLSLANRPPNGKCTLTTDIASTRDGLKTVDLEDDMALKIYTDGLGQDGMASAAAVLYKDGAAMEALRYQLGPLWRPAHPLWPLSPLMPDRPSGWPSTYKDRLHTLSNRKLALSTMAFPKEVLGSSQNGCKAAGLLGTTGCQWCKGSP